VTRYMRGGDTISRTRLFGEKNIPEYPSRDEVEPLSTRSTLAPIARLIVAFWARASPSLFASRASLFDEGREGGTGCESSIYYNEARS